MAWGARFSRPLSKYLGANYALATSAMKL